METLQARLDEMDRKLDYVVERQQYAEELILEMTPIAREAMTAAAAQLSEWEAKGLLSMTGELSALLGQYMPQIVDTLRNVLQPDVLELANEATDVLHHAEDVEPVGVFGAMRATARDEDIKRGMAVALELLRHLGQARGGHSVERHAPPAPAPRPASPPVRPTVTELPPPPRPVDLARATEPVMWEGHAFTHEGFLLDPTTWDEALAAKMAAGVGIQLTDEHWTVLQWARQDFLEHGASPNVRRVAAGSEVGTKRMYELFPKSPGKTAAMLAGIPKPVGCV